MTKSNTETVSLIRLNSITNWDKLEPNDQETVRAEMEGLAEDLRYEAQSKIAVGKRLVLLRKILEPKKMFVAAIDAMFGMSRATAYRYIEMYIAASEKLPKPILEAAIRRGYKTVHLKIIAQNPPPKTNDPAKIAEYLDVIERSPTPIRSENADDPKIMLKECINFVGSRYERLPRSQKARTEWVKDLVGMLMTKVGVASQQSFSPIAVPDSFRIVRGRPKQSAA